MHYFMMSFEALTIHSRHSRLSALLRIKIFVKSGVDKVAYQLTIICFSNRLLIVSTLLVAVFVNGADATRSE